MFVKPAEGLSVPDPERGGYLPPEGAEVPETQYWIRAEQSGDVAIAEPGAAVQAPALSKSTTKPKA